MERDPVGTRASAAAELRLLRGRRPAGRPGCARPARGAGVSWFQVKPTAPFGTVELPYGIYSAEGRPRRVGVALGDQVIDLAGFCRASGQDPRLFEASTLNPFLAAGPPVWAETRRLLAAAVADPSGRARVEPHLTPLTGVRLHLPIEVADYVDFYASEHHASNV